MQRKSAHILFISMHSFSKPKYSYIFQVVSLRLFLIVKGVAWSLNERNITKSFDVIINHEANQKRAGNNKYCIDCPEVNLKAPIQLEYTQILSLR